MGTNGTDDLASDKHGDNRECVLVADQLEIGNSDQSSVSPSCDAPAPRLLRTPRDAEEQAAAWMRHLGWTDARCTGAGADGGIDVVAPDAVAQVKAEQRPTGRPQVQQLFGAAAGRIALFFAIAGYTAEAIGWADAQGVALFELDLAGLITARNPGAARVLDRVNATDRQGGGAVTFTRESCVLPYGAIWRPPARVKAVYTVPEHFGFILAGASYAETTFVLCRDGIITIEPDRPQVDSAIERSSGGFTADLVDVNAAGAVLWYFDDHVVESWHGQRRWTFTPSDVGIGDTFGHGVGNDRAAWFSADDGRLVVLDLTTGEIVADTRAPCAPASMACVIARDRLVTTARAPSRGRRHSGLSLVLVCVDLKRCVTVWETPLSTAFVPHSVSDGLVAGRCFAEDGRPLGFAGYDLETGAIRWEFRTVLRGDGPFQTPWGTLIGVGEGDYWQVLDRSGTPRFRLAPGGIAAIDGAGRLLYQATKPIDEGGLLSIRFVSLIDGATGSIPLCIPADEYVVESVTFTNGLETVVGAWRVAERPARLAIVCAA